MSSEEWTRHEYVPRSSQLEDVPLGHVYATLIEMGKGSIAPDVRGFLDYVATAPDTPSLEGITLAHRLDTPEIVTSVFCYLQEIHGFSQGGAALFLADMGEGDSLRPVGDYRT